MRIANVTSPMSFRQGSGMDKLERESAMNSEKSLKVRKVKPIML
jgi:hypothetical protein